MVVCAEDAVGVAVALSSGAPAVVVCKLLAIFFTVCSVTGEEAAPVDVPTLASVVDGGSLAAATPAVPSASGTSSTATRPAKLGGEAALSSVVSVTSWSMSSRGVTFPAHATLLCKYGSRSASC